MKLHLQRLALLLVVTAVSAQSAFSQYYPLPGSASNAPVICTNCNRADGTPSENAWGENNTGLKTWPFSSPLKAHVGRIVDSTIVTDFQGNFRTARARQIQFAPTQRGTVPPRAYVQIGSAVAAYSLDKFFSTTLPSGTVKINQVVSGVNRGGYPAELVARWDSYAYPEASGSGWETPINDGMNRLEGFDFDDRGYLYFAAGTPFGFGIVRDGGQTNGALMTLSRQIQSPAINPKNAFAFKVGSSYYYMTSDGNAWLVYNVTNPSAPTEHGSVRTGTSYGFYAWAKDDAHSTVALHNAAGRVEIWNYSTLANGGAPAASFTASEGAYRDLTVDEEGNFWTLRVNKSTKRAAIVKFRRTGSSYTQEVFSSAITEWFDGASSAATRVINYGDKFLTVVGTLVVDGVQASDVLLFKIENGAPVRVDLGNFFAKYYHRASPRGYATPPLPSYVSVSSGAYTIKWNNKTYLIYQVQGLGDVYELEAGDSINVTRRPGTFGTQNQYARSTESGPFYSDKLGFRVTSSNPNWQYQVNWNFGNPEAGSALNSRDGATGDDVTYQYTGLSNAQAITASKDVRATAKTNAELESGTSVSMLVPKARIGVAGSSVVIEEDNASLTLVAGERLVDASDGEVEGHYSDWTVGGTSVKQAPNTPVQITTVGSQVVRLDSRYGIYDATFNTNGSAFVDSIRNLTVETRPFLVEFDAPVKGSDSSVTFKGKSRKSSLTDVFPATVLTWKVTWTLTKGGTDVVPMQEATVAVGTIPTFKVANRNQITSGSKLTLTVSTLQGELPGDAAFAQHSISQDLVPPDPYIEKTGCANIGAPCSFVVKSQTGQSLDDWSVQWTIASSTAQKTGSGTSFTPVLTAAGRYTVSLVATNDLFDANASLAAFDVAAPLCSDPPTSKQISVYSSCTQCAVNEEVTFHAEPWGYLFDNCEEFHWTFGDGSTSKTNTWEAKHKYTASGSRQVKVKVVKGTKQSVEFTKTLTIGTVEQPSTCTVPSSITITYSGNFGCAPGVACKTGERVTFTAKRGVAGSLQDCDKTTWTFEDDSTSTSRSPARTFSTVGSKDISVVVSNIKGTAAKVTTRVTVVQGDNTGGCGAPPNDRQVFIEYSGKTSGCIKGGANCKPGEVIELRAMSFGYIFQDCDRYEWDFGDNSAKATTQDATHVYNGTDLVYRAKLRVYNSSNTTGTTVTVDLKFGEVPVLPQPQLAYSGFPAMGAKGTAVTFRVNSNIDATGWEWNFGDGTGVDRTQASVIGKTATIQHTFNKTGKFAVTVKARNSADVTTAPLALATGEITIDETPEYRFLLPVVTHAAGQNGSSWRTDIQIYTPDPNVSPQNPTTATVQFKNFALRELPIFASTMILEDYMRTITPIDDAGPMIITVRSTYAPQIWTRTYNQTANGTFGQFIPAIRLDAAGGGGAVGEGTYYLAGLRSDERYRSNIGFVNPTAQTMTATIRVYDDQRTPIGQFTRTLAPFQLDQVNNLRGILTNLPSDRPFSMEIDAPAGQWLIAYASFIDSGSNDPVYIQAVRSSDLSSQDNKEIIIPGVGHTGAWRSDVTIFNPDSQQINVDLEYLDATGNKVGEAKSVPIRQGEFVQYEDVIKQGVLGGSVPDGLGMLRVKVLDSPIPNAHFPMAFARTYNDEGTGRTYGQGISGFAGPKANVKPGRAALIPGIRSSNLYGTNIGLTNTTSTPATVTVKMLDPMTGAESVLNTFTLAAYQSVVGPLNLGAVERASLKVEVSGGSVWAFASIIDKGTKDPEYIPATPLAP